MTNCSAYQCSQFCFDQALACLEVARRISPSHRATFIRMAAKWMALGITDHVQIIGELLDAARKAVPTKPTPTPAQRRRQFRVIQDDLFDE